MRGLRVLGSVALLIVVTIAAVAVATRGHGASSPRQGVAIPPGTNPLSVPASVTSRQLLNGSAATFDSSTGGWSSTSATLSTVPTPTRHGTGALEAVTALGGSMTMWSPSESISPGDRVVGTAHIRAVSAPRPARAELRFLDSDGTVTDTEDVDQQATDTLTGWTTLPLVAALAPQHATHVELGVAFPVIGAGGAHLVDDASMSETPGGSTAVVGPLTVRGNQILDGNGKPLILRGIQRFGLEGGTKTPLPTDSEIGQLKEWGANEVRISLGEQKWLSTNCHYESDYEQKVDQVVQWVTSRGMVALLNLHFATLTDCGPPGLTPMADSPGAVTFWQEVATRYANNPLVAFDLFNEPTVSQSVWLDGGFYVQSKVTVQAAGMQQLYNTVRGTGAKNLVVISGLDYADHPPTQTVQGYNIAYGAHAYQCEASPPPSCTTPNPYDAAVPLHHWVTFAKTYPVLVTEFGWPDGDDGRYNASVVAYAEKHGWGWSGFAWDGGTDGKFDLVQAHPASDGVTIEPNAGGMPLVAGFAKNTLAASH